MRIVNYHHWEDIEQHKEDWLSLQERSHVSIFSTYQFLKTFWSNFKEYHHPKFGLKKQLNVLFIYKNDHLIAILPLMKVQRKRKKIFNIDYLELLGQQFFTSNLDIIANHLEGEDWMEIKAWIYTHIKFHKLSFQLINEGSFLHQLSAPAQLLAYNTSPELHTEGYLNYEDYKKNGMSKNFQKIVNNSYNRFAKTGEEYSFIYEPYNKEQHLKLIDKLSGSKKQDDKYNVYESAEMRSFIDEIYLYFDAHISILKLGNQAIAYQAYIYYKNQCMWFDLSFDRNFRDLRPGILIYDEGLKRNFSFRNILGYGEDQNKLGIANKKVALFMCQFNGNMILSNFF